jgi:uncharacterized protein (DUF58 family)
MRPWQVVALALALLFFALTTGWRVLYLLAYVLLATLFFSYLWTVLNLRGLSLSRVSSATRVQVGEILEERFALENHSSLPKLGVQITDESDLPNHYAGHVASVRGRSRVPWKTRTLCRRRGRYVLGPAVVTSRDLLGLFQRRMLLVQPRPLLVLPAVLPITRFDLYPGELPGHGRGSQRALQTTTNAVTVRPYVSGDSMNRIHWPTSARLRQLMVKEFDLDPSIDAWIFLDLQQNVQAGEDDASTEEYGVTIAATVANYLLENDVAVGLVVNAGHYEFLNLDRGQRQIERILELLACIHAGPGPSLSEALAIQGMHFARNTAAIVITPSWHDDWQEGLQQLRRRGVKPAVIAIDPSSFDVYPSNEHAVDVLISLGIPTMVIRRGDPLVHVLEEGPIV